MSAVSCLFWEGLFCSNQSAASDLSVPPTSVFSWQAVEVVFGAVNIFSCRSNKSKGLRVVTSASQPTATFTAALDHTCYHFCAIFLALAKEADVPICNPSYKAVIGSVVFPVGETAVNTTPELLACNHVSLKIIWKQCHRFSLVDKL